MSLFGFRDKNDDDHYEKVRRSSKADLARRIQDAKAELDRGPSSAARSALMDAERQLKEL
ncbi:hypothetical protein [Nocardiopsis sp. JB363]|uniref:hypothetical protein n=1 Tax=Nocardiopsis sp. JB363 TaxID=1434837 RepID=UPI000B363BE0|nr:hypothetical protein [Nocardiopsis sp. JB363]